MFMHSNIVTNYLDGGMDLLANEDMQQHKQVSSTNKDLHRE